MYRLLKLIAATVFVLLSLFAGKAASRIALASQNLPSCHTLPGVKDIAFSPDGKYMRVGHKSEQIKDWFYRTQWTIMDEIEQDDQVPGV